jgi:hypothetical protein
MSAIENFRKHQDDQMRAKQWAGLIGKIYGGGGGGTGRLSTLSVTAQVYHQERDGAKNYHDLPDALRFELQAAIVNNFDGLLAEALAAMESKRSHLAAEAVAEHAELMREAGLERATP